MWGIIGTWRMALEGIEDAGEALSGGKNALDSVEIAIRRVEECPDYHSVGYSGLPNEMGQVELDAAMMDGDTFSIGAVAGIREMMHPVSVAKKLMQEKHSNFLVGEGALEYAIKNGFSKENLMTEYTQSEWEKRRSKQQELKAYDGHDTVGMVGLDSFGRIVAATSTSGLFMKRMGRVGDSPLPGSGFYADSEIGGATATGLGEVIYKGILSYEIVKRMGQGFSPSEACRTAVSEFDRQLKKRAGESNDISVVAMNKDGEWGVYTNTKHFSFVVATDKTPPTVYIASLEEGELKLRRPDDEWISSHTE